MHPYDVEAYTWQRHRELEAEADLHRAARSARGAYPASARRLAHGLGNLLVRIGTALQAYAEQTWLPVPEAPNRPDQSTAV